MALSHEEFAQLAALARLGLSDRERDEMQGGFETVLDYVARLSQVDTSGVEDGASELDSTSFRADIVGEENDSVRTVIIQNFPEKEGDLLRVPAVFRAPKGSRESV